MDRHLLLPESDKDKRVTRLLKNQKKGILHLVFSRVGLVMSLLILEIYWLVLVYQWLNTYFNWFAAAQTIFGIYMYFHMFNSDMDATGKLTWLMLLSLCPIPASIFYFFTRNEIGHRTLKARVAEVIAETRDKLTQTERTIKDPVIVDSATDDLCHYLNLTGSYPIYERTQAEYYPLGEDMFEAMLRELEKAEKFIFLEYFIIDEGYMWGRILKILIDKAREGVDVRVMYDGMCEISTLTADYPKRLEKLGIRCKAFSPIHPFLSTHYNYRDHRKIMVIDGNVAFNGGVNLADEYINKKERFGHWKDTGLMLRGEAVASFTLLFLQMWNLIETDVRWDEFLHSPIDIPSDGYVIPYGDCPLDDYKVGENVYIDILNRARTYVHIMTPYLILDNELESALKFAAQRGVDVKLILPGIPDKKAAYALAKSHYRYLHEAGIQIYEYEPGFVHAKVCVCDDEKAVVGTINLDYRSLYHHFECATYLYRCSCITEIEKDFEETLNKCRQVTDESIREEKLSYRLLGVFMKLVAPLM